MITLRTANITDLKTLQYWDKQEHVIASDPNDDWNWEHELSRTPEWREQLIAELDGTPIGFIQIIDAAKEETHYWGEIEDNTRAIDIWIGEKQNLSKGYGSEMMKLALDRCFKNDKINRVLIDPLANNKDAIRFYKRLGFEFIEKRKFNEDDCEVYEITKGKWLNLK